MGGSHASFCVTRWSMLARGDRDEIIRLYWRPVYLHLRRRGSSVEEAKDLTQEFFTAFMEKEYEKQADPARGRFRDFLRAAVDHFASNQRARARAQKRGGLAMDSS